MLISCANTIKGSNKCQSRVQCRGQGLGGSRGGGGRRLTHGIVVRPRGLIKTEAKPREWVEASGWGWGVEGGLGASSECRGRAAAVSDGARRC